MSQLLLGGLPFQFELACAAVATVVRESEKVDHARFTLVHLTAIPLGEPAKPQ